MKTIKQAYRNEPLLTSLTLSIIGIAALILLLAIPTFAPNLFTNPLGNPTGTAIDLLQLATGLLFIVALFAVYVDHRTPRAKQDPYADFFAQSPRQRNRLTLTLGWERINRNGQVNRRVMMMAV